MSPLHHALVLFQRILSTTMKNSRMLSYFLSSTFMEAPPTGSSIVRSRGLTPSRASYGPSLRLGEEDDDSRRATRNGDGMWAIDGDLDDVIDALSYNWYDI
mmetsp:Transcript_26528/g.37023  ORF Transcript_26528/g.37023 Transcript_26528/m.37023 type:complete len:101 (-) Transcript_26528:771-1073(-)